MDRDKSKAFTLKEMRHLLALFGASAALIGADSLTLRKLHLFEQREFAVFSKSICGVKVPDSHRVRSRSESFFAYFFCGVKKYERNKISFIFKNVSLNTVS